MKEQTVDELAREVIDLVWELAMRAPITKLPSTTRPPSGRPS